MRDLKRDVLQIVFAGAAKGDGGRTWLTRRGRSGGEGIVALCEEAARDRAGLGDFGGRTFGDEVAASGTGFGTHFQNPVAGLQHVEVVFHDDERVASLREAMEQADQTRNVLAVQARRRFVEEQERARFARIDLRKITDQFEALGFSAGKRRERLAHREIAEADFLQAGELRGGWRAFAQELTRLGYRHRQQIADGLTVIVKA